MFHREHGRIPTVEDVKKMWTLNTHQKLDLQENAYHKAVMIWYYDKWLPVAAGKHWWGPSTRYYSLVTAKVMVLNETKPSVSQTSEAFGLLVLDNYWKKWTAIVQWHKDNPDQEVPKKAPDNAPFKAKWSQASNGQVKYGGWDPEAYVAFEAHQQAVEDHRAQDKRNDLRHETLVYEKLRQRHNILEDQPGKKRRRARAVPVVAQEPLVKRIRRRDA